MSVPVILRAAPVVTNEQLLEPETVRHHELYTRRALRPLPGRELRDVPICLEHDKEVRIGRVTALRVEEAPGGAWLMIHAALDEPPDWLRRWETAVSIARSAFDTRTPWGAQWELVQGAILTEVSLLRYGSKPGRWLPSGRMGRGRVCERLLAAPRVSVSFCGVFFCGVSVAWVAAPPLGA